MITVELKQLRFFAYHGLYPEERKTGNEFEVQLAVSYEAENEVISGIHSTIDYTSLYSIIKEQFDTPVDLLETLITNIAGEIKTAFPQSKKINISISKPHPPVKNFIGVVSVSFSKEY